MVVSKAAWHRMNIRSSSPLGGVLEQGLLAYLVPGLDLIQQIFLWREVFHLVNMVLCFLLDKGLDGWTRLRSL